MKKQQTFIIIVDFLIALFAFWISRYFGHLPRWYFLVLASALWVILSYAGGKLNFELYKKTIYALNGIFLADFLIGACLYLLYKFFVPDYEYDYSILLATSIMIVLEWTLYLLLRRFVYQKIMYLYEDPVIDNADQLEKCGKSELDAVHTPEDLKKVMSLIGQSRSCQDIVHALRTDGFVSPTTVVLDDPNPETIFKFKHKPISLIVQTCPLNDMRYICRSLAYANYCLEDDGVILCHCTPASVRREKLLKSNPPVLAQIVCFLDYLLNRVIPKLWNMKCVYFQFTNGKNRSLTRVEVLGRLYREGFEVIQERIFNDELCVIARKVKEPIRGDQPSYGVLIRLKRRGENGKTIGVYKLRTMFAFSEYLQSYIYKQEGLREGGKIADDYRVSKLGRILRRCWIDELPMLINWFKGDLKLVGVRPLSDQYFNLYTKELQDLRIKVKPGLVPPFYVDMPKTLDEIEDSETRYLNAYLAHPFRTDWTYFWKAFDNIVLKGKRSK